MEEKNHEESNVAESGSYKKCPESSSGHVRSAQMLPGSPDVCPLPKSEVPVSLHEPTLIPATHSAPAKHLATNTMQCPHQQIHWRVCLLLLPRPQGPSLPTVLSSPTRSFPGTPCCPCRACHLHDHSILGLLLTWPSQPSGTTLTYVC